LDVLCGPCRLSYNTAALHVLLGKVRPLSFTQHLPLATEALAGTLAKVGDQRPAATAIGLASSTVCLADVGSGSRGCVSTDAIFV
jgi:hypothetical protein